MLEAEVRDVVAVPKAAVRVEGSEQQNVVYVVASGRITRKVVQTGVDDSERGLVQVTGIDAGDSVIIGPVDGLADGMRVDVGRSGEPVDGQKAR